MAHHLLRYAVAPDYRARRGDHRAAHLDHARAAVARGALLLGGAVEDGDGDVAGALLLFAGDGPAAAEAFAAADPYVLNGLVERWWVERWVTVVGAGVGGPAGPVAP